MAKKGNLSINSENIFPVIKKWLYSDHDIFARELISNGCDAVTKLKKLDMIGEYSYPDDFENKITVIASPENKTLKFIDTGLGMDADEIEEYITQIAFSGATAFLDKYKDKTNEDQIIGHFGLGFYSAFMVADEVHIDSLSYKKDAKAVHWECDGGTEYTIEDGDRTEVGTEITLFLNEDSLEFANEYRIREVIKKYCSFMPVNIYLQKDGAEPEEEPKALNETHPLWTKHPNDVTKEEYLEFYRNVFMDYKEPLFWIHLNMDYPFNLKGILYFPKINMEYESIEGTIKLYNNQVFVADNIKEVIPEFLMLLKGVIDCPDLPLNVSRSALQNDGFVKKISDYISKKVADKLAGMCKTEKEEYEKYWDDISPFIKFGCLKDDKFCEKMTDYILFKNLNGKYETLPECLELNAKEAAADEDGNPIEAEEVTADNASEDEDYSEKEPRKVIYYVTDEVQQSQYINMFKAQKLDAVILTHNIDQPFIQQLESKNEDIKFARIDADLTDVFKARTSKKDAKNLETLTAELQELFRKALKKDSLIVKVEKLKNKATSSMITVSEESRRMQDMLKMYSMPGMNFGTPGDEGITLVLNSQNELVKYISEHQDSDNAKLFAEQLYDLALIANKPLSPEEMTKFVARSNKIMLELSKSEEK